MRRHSLALVVALVAVAGLSAAGYASAVVVTPGDVVRSPSGCPVPLPQDLVAEEDRVATVVPRATAPTATDHARDGFDLRGALDDVRALSGRFVPVASFVLPSTGLDVTVLSDGPITVDVEALDRLTRLSLAQPGLFRNARVAEVQRCYGDRILDAGELAGHELRLVVPADPATCFRGGRLVALDSPSDVATCDSAGVTLPEVSIRPRLLGLDLAHARAPATIMVTASTSPGRDAEGALAGLLLHELHHLVENAFGLTPWSGSLNHYEQRAYYVEREVRRHLRSRGLRLPRPVAFPDVGEGPADR